MEGAEGGMQVQYQINGHTMTAVCDATMIIVLCAVTNWSMVNLMHAGEVAITVPYRIVCTQL
jgi:hypothetical protein